MEKYTDIAPNLLKELSDIKVITIAVMIVCITIVVGISSDESDDILSARQGLEQCVIKDGYLNRSGNLQPKVIWVKDCTKTLKAIKDTK